MKICSNCGIQLSCGCQRRDASDGKSCCDQCINDYELKINPPAPSPSPSPKVVSTKKVSVTKETTNNEQ